MAELLKVFFNSGYRRAWLGYDKDRSVARNSNINNTLRILLGVNGSEIIRFDMFVCVAAVRSLWLRLASRITRYLWDRKAQAPCLNEHVATNILHPIPPDRVENRGVRMGERKDHRLP
jgi:hypothetical protein